MGLYENMLNEMDDATLDRFINLAAEARKRDNQKRERLWRKVRDAILEYTSSYGEIDVTNFCEIDFSIDSHANFSSCGEIEIKREEYQ